MMLASELGDLLRTEIPIAQTIGIRNFTLSENHFSFELPLQPNINHKGTLFGGSLYSAGALACYGLFLSEIRAKDFGTNNIVISEGSMKYVAPVDQDAVVRASWSSPEEKQEFFDTLAAKNRARVLMRAKIEINGKLCAEFSGYFVAKI